MNIHRQITPLVIAALLTGACSTRPRAFVPTPNPAIADQAAFQRDFETCRTLAAQGHSSNFKSAALATGGGAAAGLGAGVVLAPVGLAGGAGAAAATMALPFIGFAVGFGISRAIRSGREKKLKAAMGNCLAEYGHSVSGWTPVKKPRRSGENPEAPKSAMQQGEGA